MTELSCNTSPDRHEATLRRFWSKVDVRGPADCWPWQGSRSSLGYGMFRAGHGRTFVASRFLLEEISERLLTGDEFACHSCDNPPCCNPAHLWAGTPLQNRRDCIAKGRSFGATKTHCVHGHELTGVNIKMKGKKRLCRECWRAGKRATYARRLSTLNPEGV